VCQRCRGLGKISAQTCPQCPGQEFYEEDRQYHLSIPPGTRDGARLRLAGEGGEGFRHGSPGNLEVVIHVQSHEMFRRVGNDIHCQIKVSFAQAALGGPIRIPTLDGFQMMDLPRGAQSGKIFRIPQAGAPGGIHHPPGDQVMEIVVTTPDSLNFRQLEILREIRQLGQEELSLGGL
jgi:molecular chaperone DnaJ